MLLRQLRHLIDVLLSKLAVLDAEVSKSLCARLTKLANAQTKLTRRLLRLHVLNRSLKTKPCALKSADLCQLLRAQTKLTRRLCRRCRSTCARLAKLTRKRCQLLLSALRLLKRLL